MLQLVWIPGRCLGRSRCSWERTGEGAVGGSVFYFCPPPPSPHTHLEYQLTSVRVSCCLILWRVQVPGVVSVMASVLNMSLLQECVKDWHPA